MIVDDRCRQAAGNRANGRRGRNVRHRGRGPVPYPLISAASRRESRRLSRLSADFGSQTDKWATVPSERSRGRCCSVPEKSSASSPPTNSPGALRLTQRAFRRANVRSFKRRRLWARQRHRCAATTVKSLGVPAGTFVRAFPADDPAARPWPRQRRDAGDFGRGSGWQRGRVSGRFGWCPRQDSNLQPTD